MFSLFLALRSHVRALTHPLDHTPHTIHHTPHRYLSYPVKVLVDAVGLLRRYGLSGLTGLLMRRDFVEAAEVLKDLGGLEELFASAPLHELSCALYYKMALDRGKRGCRPEEEHLLHLAAAASASAARDSAASSGAGVGAENEEGDRSKRERESSTDGSVSEIGDDNDNQKWPETAKADAAEVELTLAVEMAPLALAAVYQSSDVELQRVAASVGYRTLFACLDSRPEQPAHAGTFLSRADVARMRHGMAILSRSVGRSLKYSC